MATSNFYDTHNFHIIYRWWIQRRVNRLHLKSDCWLQPKFVEQSSQWTSMGLSALLRSFLRMMVATVLAGWDFWSLGSHYFCQAHLASQPLPPHACWRLCSDIFWLCHIQTMDTMKAARRTAALAPAIADDNIVSIDTGGLERKEGRKKGKSECILIKCWFIIIY